MTNQQLALSGEYSLSQIPSNVWPDLRSNYRNASANDNRSVPQYLSFGKTLEP